MPSTVRRLPAGLIAAAFALVAPLSTSGAQKVPRLSPGAYRYLDAAVGPFLERIGARSLTRHLAEVPRDLRMRAIDERIRQRLAEGARSRAQRDELTELLLIRDARRLSREATHVPGDPNLADSRLAATVMTPSAPTSSPVGALDVKQPDFLEALQLAHTRLTARLGREPTADELTREVGWSLTPTSQRSVKRTRSFKWPAVEVTYRSESTTDGTTTVHEFNVPLGKLVKTALKCEALFRAVDPNASCFGTVWDALQ